jgi:hypothetical protein
MLDAVIGPYRIVGKLGEGIMGPVYKAFDETLSRDVVVKIVDLQLAETEGIASFRSDTATLMAMNHPGIASTYEFVHSDHGLLVVTEFVRGQTLETIIERLGALPPDHAAYLIDQLLLVLTAAHGAGVVHGNIKPTNVFVTEHGGLKVTEFGVARVCGQSSAGVRGEASDQDGDIYAVGMLLHRLLTGTSPYSAMAANFQRPPLAGDQRDDLPDWCDSILQRALAHKPQDRFRTVGEFRETLGRLTCRPATASTAAFRISDADVGTPELDVAEPGATGTVGARSAPFSAPPSSVGFAEPLTTTELLEDAADCAMVAVREQHLAWSGSALAMVAGGLALVAAAVLWHPAEPAKPEESLPRPAPPMAAGAAIDTAPRPAPSVAPAIAPAPKNVSPASAPPAVPSSARIRSTAAALPPVVFDAQVLVGPENHQRKSHVMLAEGKIFVRDAGDQQLLQTVSYADVTSISYSHGRKPMWNAPDGPTVTAQTGSSILGGDRHWLSVRTKNSGNPFLVLRLAENADVRNAIAALEARTGHKTVFVTEARKGN